LFLNVVYNPMAGVFNLCTLNFSYILKYEWLVNQSMRKLKTIER
jgi:hypothetical protein